MPKTIDNEDWLYRMVRPAHCPNGELVSDAFDDNRDEQSFNLVSVSTPKYTLEKFAGFPAARQRCKKKDGQADPTFLEMYDRGYRVAVSSVEFVRRIGLTFKPEANEDEYNVETGHVNVIGAKYKAAILSDNAHVLTREEMETGFSPLAFYAAFAAICFKCPVVSLS